MAAITLSNSDARRAMITYHLQPGTLPEVFDRLRSIQFDPLKPAGSNHDLVLQARVPGYKVGDWEVAAYRDRLIYDGWDKQASLIPFSGWAVRRIFQHWNRGWFEEHLAEFPDAVGAVLGELENRGPMVPREFEFQLQRKELAGSWYGSSMTKRVLHSLWHVGKVMTHSRRSGQHVYDLTERVLPAGLREIPVLTEQEALASLVHNRHHAVGLLRPNAQYEVWSFGSSNKYRHGIIRQLVDQGELVPVEVDGVLFHASPLLLQALDQPKRKPKVTFIAPLDQLVWDRNAIRHLFEFDYLWEVYVPESKRKWGYYVLPVVWDDRFVARFDLQVLKGVLKVKLWHWEDPIQLPKPFWTELERTFKQFAKYCRATSAVCGPGVDSKVVEVVKHAFGNGH